MLTKQDLEIIKKSGVYFIVDYECEDIDCDDYVGNDEELLNADNIFATEEEAQEDLESFCEEFFICKECEEVCRLRDLSFTDKTCCDCHNRLVREFDEDLRDRNMDYWRDRI